MAQNLDDIAINIIVNSGQATKGLDKVERALHRVEKRADRTIKRTNALGSMFRRIFGTYLGIQTIRNTMQTARELDLIERSIVGLTKSTQDWDYVQREAFRTGTGIENVAKYYRNFYSSATMAGFGKGQVQEMYSDVLVASRAIGASQLQTGNALLALEQMLSKGKISMEELRRQLGNALPGAFEIGAKAMGVTTVKFNEMVKAGLIANDFVPKFTKELLKTYQEGFPEAIKSMDFAIVNLNTSWKLLQKEFMGGELGKSFVEATNELTNLLRSPEFKDLIKGLGYIMSLLVKIFSFAIKHIHLTIYLLGSAGLAKVLLANTRLLTRLGRAFILFFGGRQLQAIKHLTKGLWAMNAPFMVMYGKILAIIGVLLIAQDIIYGILNYINPNLGLKSITGDIIESTPEAEFNPKGRGHKKTASESVESHRRAAMKASEISTREKGFLDNIPMPAHLKHMIYSMNAEKTQQQTINVSVGDINVDGSKDPLATGQTIKDVLASIVNNWTMANGGESYA